MLARLQVVKPTYNTMLNKSHPLAQGLVSAFLFNEKSGDKCFNTASGKVCTTVNDPAWVDNSIEFDTTNYVEFNPYTQFDGKFLTVLALIKFQSVFTAYPRIIDRVYNGQFSFYLADVGVAVELSWALSTSGGSVDRGTSGSVIVPAQQWFTAGLVYDGNNAHTYVDGILQESYGTGISGGLSTSTSNVRIGQRSDGSNRGFDGSIKYIYVWNRALSTEEVAFITANPYIIYKRNFNIIPFFNGSGSPSIPIPVLLHHYKQLGAA